MIKHEVINLEIYTIGHSTHTKKKFIDMLRYASIEVLVDVRAFPGSRKFPHFTKKCMKVWLEDAGIAYHHIAELGGRKRKSDQVVPELNDSWNNQSFHNYADYTLTDEFNDGISDLANLAKEKRTAYCCSERHPSRCHRLVISNWLGANGWTVKHIIDGYQGETEIVEHELGKWGAMPIIEEDGTVVYPKT